MMADLFAQWPVVVVFTPLVTVLAAIIGWMIRFTITRQSQRDDKQEERMDRMAKKMDYYETVKPNSPMRWCAS